MAHLGTWENCGWIGVKNAPHFRKAAHLLRICTAPTTFKWVKGHDGNEGNEGSDLLAKEGARKNKVDPINLDIPIEFDIQRARLNALTQAIAYRGIKDSKKVPTRNMTRGNLQKARDTIYEYTGSLETDESIWHSIRKQEIQTKIRQFLFKTMHGTQKIGKFWAAIETYAHHEHCRECGVTETMEHILTRCREPPVRIIWSLTELAWPSKFLEWPQISLGLILGCGCITDRKNDRREFPNENWPRQQEKRGASRLATILISEAAHLIWVLHCERAIHGKQHTDNEINTRWRNIVNTRLTSNKIIATKIKREKKFTNLVKNIWQTLLIKDAPLPHDWINNREVLVGRRPRYAPFEED